MRVRLAAASILLVVAGVSCSDDGAKPVGERADAYAAMVEAVVGAEPFADLDEATELVVWLYPLVGDETIDLEVQVGVLDRLEDFATVRFVDAFDEAVDEDDEDVPVIDDGVVVGLALFEDVPARTEATRYESEDDEPETVALARAGSSWQVVENAP